MKGPAADRAEALEGVARVESLLADVEQLPDPVARDKATSALAALLDLYGEALERIVEEVAARDEGEIADALAADQLVAHVLIVHGLHPVPLPERVQGALGEVRPYLESHGGNVELLGVEAGVVRLRLQGSCSGCPSSSVTLKLAVENAIRKAAPEIEEIEAEDEAESAPAPTLLQIEVIGSNGNGADGGNGDAPGADADWSTAGGLPDLRDDRPLVKSIAGEALIFLRCAGEIYAYREPCPECGTSLGEASQRGTELACARCENRYDVMRAGRCLDSPQLHLDPVPLLLDENGLVRVALGVAA